MMLKTAQLCCIVLTLCIITPIGIGFLMPSTATQETIYVNGDTSNITNDIRNATSDYYGDYTGEANNSLWGLYPGLPNVTYLKISDSPTSTPILNVSTNTGYFDNSDQDTSMATNNADQNEYAYSMVYSGISPGALIYTHTYIEDGQTVIDQEYGIYSAHWLRTQGKMIIDGEEISLNPGEIYSVSSSSTSQTSYTIYSQDRLQFADLTGGINLANGVTTYWQNNYDNAEIVITAIMDPLCSFEIGSWTVSRSAAGLVTMEYNVTSETIELGNYSNISIVINEDGVTLNGLMAADLIDDPEARTISSINMPDWSWPISFKRIPVTSINTVSGSTNLLRLFVYSAAIKVGEYSSTVDKSLDLSNYWANMRGYSIRFTNGSTIGKDASLVVAGYTFDLYPRTGTIVYNGISYNLTGSIISIVNDGTKFYGYLNSADITSSLDVSDWKDIELNGQWGSIGLSASEMIPKNTDQYNWMAGHFNLDIKEIAGIGLLTSALAFVGAAFIGARSGLKTFWLMVTAGGCAAFYLVLFL